MLMQSPIRSAAIAPTASLPPRHPVPAKDDLLGALDLMGSQMTFGPNEEIFGEDEPAEYVYKVTSGAVRTYKILNETTLGALVKDLAAQGKRPHNRTDNELHRKATRPRHPKGRR